MSPLSVPAAFHAFVATRMALANCAAHDVAHCYRVANLAHKIALTESSADPTIAFYGGLLHDVLDHKLYGSEGTESTEREMRGLLEGELQMNSAAVGKVFEIVKNVGYKNMICPRDVFDPFKLSVEYRCVQDADLLDAIGAIGVARCMAFSGRCNRKLFGGQLLEGTSAVSREEYLKSQKSADSSAIVHFFEKLLRIRLLFTTDEGKKLGEQRHENMVTFLRQVDQELVDAGDESAGSISEALKSF